MRVGLGTSRSLCPQSTCENAPRWSRSPMASQSPDNAGLESSKPSIFVMESNYRALNYLGRPLGRSYRVHLFSEPQPLLQSLKTEKRPDIFLLAWDGAKTSRSFFRHLRTA